MNNFKPYPFVNPYFTIYAAERATLARKIPRKTPLITTQAIHQIYKLLDDCKWETHCGVNALRSEITNPKYEVTKLWSWWRLHAWPGSEARTTVTHKEPKQLLYGTKSEKMNNLAYYLNILLLTVVFTKLFSLVWTG